MSKNIQSETLYGPGGDNPATLKESEGKDDTLKNMAEMLTPEERTEMLRILQGMQKKDRMSGTLSLDDSSDTQTGEELAGE